MRHDETRAGDDKEDEEEADEDEQNEEEDVHDHVRSLELIVDTGLFASLLCLGHLEIDCGILELGTLQVRYISVAFSLDLLQEQVLRASEAEDWHGHPIVELLLCDDLKVDNGIEVGMDCFNVRWRFDRERWQCRDQLHRIENVP